MSDVDSTDGTITPTGVPAVPTTAHPHYTSTYCIHGLHEQCRRTCKTCGSPCLCPCGHPEPAAPGVDEQTEPRAHRDMPVVRCDIVRTHWAHVYPVDGEKVACPGLLPHSVPLTDAAAPDPAVCIAADPDHAGMTCDEYDAALDAAEGCCGGHSSRCALVMGEHGPCCDDCPEWGGDA